MKKITMFGIMALLLVSSAFGWYEGQKLNEAEFLALSETDIHNIVYDYREYSEIEETAYSYNKEWSYLTVVYYPEYYALERFQQISSVSKYDYNLCRETHSANWCNYVLEYGVNTQYFWDNYYWREVYPAQQQINFFSDAVIQEIVWMQENI